MTPIQRERILKLLLGLFLLFFAGILIRIIWSADNLVARWMGRGKGTASSGTSLIESTRSLLKKSHDIEKLSEVESMTSIGDRTQKIDFSVLGKWKYIEGKTPIPANVKALDGKILELTGFMMPINEVKNIRQFILIQSLWGCCFGQAPEANHILVVHMEDEKRVDFYPDPIRVTGRFSVGETREEGFLVSIYRLDAHKVEVK